MKRTRSIRALAAAALALLLAAAMLVFAAACDVKGPEPSENTDGLTDAEKAKIIKVAEAFYESGIEVDAESALPLSQIESFVSFLYNDELTAGEDGYAVIPASEADARIKSCFGLAPVLRTYKNPSGRQDFYYKNDNYYIRVKDPAAKEIKILSYEKTEDGGVNATVELKTDDGGAELKLVFEQRDGELLVTECTRFEER